MKKVLTIVIGLVVFVALVFFLNKWITGQLNSKSTDGNSQTVSQTTETKTETSNSSVSNSGDNTESLSVTTTKLSDGISSSLPTSGTVVSKTQLNFTANSASSVKKLNYKEGDFVKAGDTIVELTGSNGAVSQTELQYQIAKQNFDFANQSLQNLQTSNQISLQSAQIQLDNALNQANGLVTDLKVIDQNISTLQNGLNYIDSSLNISRNKSTQDLHLAKMQLDDLASQVNQLQSSKMNTISQIQNITGSAVAPEQTCNSLSAPAPAPATQSPSTIATPSPLAALCATLNSQYQSIQTLYPTFDKANLAYKDAISGSQIGDTTQLSQLNQSQGQLDVLKLNKTSAEQKAGYDGTTMTSVQLAEKAFDSTRQQLKSAQDLAQNQIKLAKLNFDLASSQRDQMVIKSPIDGVVAGLNLKVGDNLAAQTPLFSVLTPNDFELEANVDLETANHLQVGSKAAVQIANHWLDTTITAVSPLPDSKTKLVKVKVSLPKIFFRVGQIMSVQLALQSNRNSPSFYLPLDAVTIGTQENFVFVVENNKAKKVTVTTGQIFGGEIEITSGLTGDEQIILAGARDVLDGQSVKVSSS